MKITTWFQVYSKLIKALITMFAILTFILYLLKTIIGKEAIKKFFKKLAADFMEMPLLFDDYISFFKKTVFWELYQKLIEAFPPIRRVIIDFVTFDVPLVLIIIVIFSFVRLSFIYNIESIRWLTFWYTYPTWWKIIVTTYRVIVIIGVLDVAVRALFMYMWALFSSNYP